MSVYNVEVGLADVDRVVAGLNIMLSDYEQGMHNAEKLMDTDDMMRKLSYHDMYRQFKSDVKMVRDRLAIMSQLRDDIAQHGYVRAYRCFVRVEEKYVLRHMKAKEVPDG